MDGDYIDIRISFDGIDWISERLPKTEYTDFLHAWKHNELWSFKRRPSGKRVVDLSTVKWIDIT